MQFTLKLLLVAVAFGCVLSCSDKDFADFKAEFGKNYDTQEENTRRKGIFCENLDRIQEHNKKFEQGLTTYTQGINAFADLTKEEFRGMLGLRLP